MNGIWCLHLPYPQTLFSRACSNRPVIKAESRHNSPWRAWQCNLIWTYYSISGGILERGILQTGKLFPSSEKKYRKGGVWEQSNLKDSFWFFLTSLGPQFSLLWCLFPWLYAHQLKLRQRIQPWQFSKSYITWLPVIWDRELLNKAGCHCLSDDWRKFVPSFRNASRD